VAHVLNGVFHDYGHVGGHAQVHGAAEAGGFSEEVEVPHGEGQLARLLHGDGYLFVFFFGGPLGVSQHHVARAQVPAHAEFDPFLGDPDGARVAEHPQVADDALELRRGHFDVARVLLLGDAQVLAVDVHELHFEVRNAVLEKRARSKKKRNYEPEGKMYQEQFVC